MGSKFRLFNVVLLAGVLASGVATAHQDPPACSGANIGQDLLVDPAGRPIRECEGVSVRSTLTWLGQCLISGGDLTIGLVDPSDPFNPNSDQIIASTAVPCLGNATVTAEGCAPGQDTSIGIGPVLAFPRAVDIAQGFMTVRARWNGVLHQAETNLPQNNVREIVVPISPCPDDTFCTDVQCVFTEGQGAECAVTDTSTTQCPDNEFCADVICNDEIDQCVRTDTSTSQCPDNEFCADIVCNEATDSCDSTDTSTTQCPDNEFCADTVCSEETDSCIRTDTSASQCPGSNECQEVVCNEATDVCDTTDTSDRCDDNDPCTLDVCHPVDGCSNTEIDPLPAECRPVGCRITGGGITNLGETTPRKTAKVERATFGGQVGAPCGCNDCYDDLEHVQGQWTHVRHRRRGRLRGPQFASLICGCDGEFDGELCNPGDRDIGPEPRPAPANMACWTGVGEFRRKETVFRVHVEDRGEPGAGDNAAPTDDVYRIWMWHVGEEETASMLLDQVCCKLREPAAREPDVVDGGNLVKGNIQIHPVTALTERGICPPPDGTCQANPD